MAYGDPQNPTIIPKNTVVSVHINQDGTLTGNSGCNEYQTTYEILPDGGMTIQPDLVSTRMICPTTQMDIETAFQTTLPYVNGYKFAPEGRMILTYTTDTGESGEMVFAVGEVPLSNTTWVLVSFGNQEIPQRVPPGTSITAIFNSGGKLSGNAGCNDYSAGYTVQANNITIGPTASTMMMCPDTMDLETMYLDALNAAVSYTIRGPNLTITTFDNLVLNYTSLALPLEGTLWTLISANAQPLPTGVDITAILLPDDTADGTSGNQGVISGSSGCNQYSAGYTLNEANLSVSAVLQTQMACEQTVMEIETAFLMALETPSTYQITGDTLELTTAEGSLTFSASRTPLTGALWVLKGLGSLEQPDEPVKGSKFTIQFFRAPTSPTGVASGTTGCNEYAAFYSSNLTEIKINSPVSTENTTCVPGLIAQEQVFFLALNDAQEYRILGNELLIPYDSGKQVLVFEATQIGLATNIPLASLDNSLWYLWTINDRPIANGTSITALFKIFEDGNGGTMDGSSGCNIYEAVFGSGLSVETTLNSRQVCAEPKGVMEQEQAYMQVLSRAPTAFG